MKMVVVLFYLSLAATFLTLLPGYLEDGGTAPTDVSDLHAALDRLRMAGGELLLLAIVKRWAGAARPPALFILCACAGVAVAIYRALEVITIITARHVHGEHATFYWVAAIATALVIGFMPVLFFTAV